MPQGGDGVTVQPTTREAYDLLHQGTLALSEIRRGGMRIDVPYLRAQIRVLERKKAQAEAAFRETELGRTWARVSGAEMALNNNRQLSHVLYKEMGLKTEKKTAKGKQSTTRGTLEELDVPGMPQLIEWRKLDKTLGTYVLGILKEQTDGVLRPFFHLYTVVTYRSSSSNFNFQNLPVRDLEQGRTVRQAILPWPGERLGEGDYGGLEVRIGACYHEDPVMLSYLNGHGDMHRDSACDLYLLDPEEVAKEVRFHAKNGWTFPQFYGSYWGQCAPNLWAVIDRFDLKTKSGVPLKEHLASKGITSYAKFEAHVKKCEDVLWDRFAVYARWKKRWIRKYEERGHFELKTGFRCQGSLARNDVTNYPVQGAAFHCLLWSLIQLHRRIKEEGWRTRIIGQIHDSMVFSFPPEEADPVFDAFFQISERDIRTAWPWIITPLEVEAEAGPVDGSWYEKKGVLREDTCREGSHIYRRKTKEGSECLTCGM